MSLILMNGSAALMVLKEGKIIIIIIKSQLQKR